VGVKLLPSSWDRVSDKADEGKRGAILLWFNFMDSHQSQTTMTNPARFDVAPRAAAENQIADLVPDAPYIA
jgi:hypothetical protein